MFDIRRIVLRPWYLAQKEELVLITVSRSGYFVYWSYVKKQLFPDGRGPRLI